MNYKIYDVLKEILLVLWIMLIVFCAFMFGLYYNSFNFDSSSIDTGTNIKMCNNQSINVSNVGEWNYCVIMETCKNLSLDETAKCLNSAVKEILNFTVRNEQDYKGNDGSFEDIIINGGDCYDWNNLYIKLAKDLGFDGEPTTFYFNRIRNGTTERVGHRYATIFEKNNSSGYCVLDERELLSCMDFDYKEWDKSIEVENGVRNNVSTQK